MSNFKIRNEIIQFEKMEWSACQNEKWDIIFFKST